MGHLREDWTILDQPAPATPADLATAAESLERTAALLVSALPAAEAAMQTAAEVRRGLDDLARYVGTVAGAVGPLEADPDHFGIRP
jgi:phytoene/squalene synthetase